MNPTPSNQDQGTNLPHTGHTKDTRHGYHTQSKQPLHQKICRLYKIKSRINAPAHRTQETSQVPNMGITPYPNKHSIRKYCT